MPTLKDRATGDGTLRREAEDGQSVSVLHQIASPGCAGWCCSPATRCAVAHTNTHCGTFRVDAVVQPDVAQLLMQNQNHGRPDAQVEHGQFRVDVMSA
jgi:hypothetical protein